jgi:hypothetical protein
MLWHWNQLTRSERTPQAKGEPHDMNLPQKQPGNKVHQMLANQNMSGTERSRGLLLNPFNHVNPLAPTTKHMYTCAQYVMANISTSTNITTLDTSCTKEIVRTVTQAPPTKTKVSQWELSLPAPQVYGQWTCDTDP